MGKSSAVQWIAASVAWFAVACGSVTSPTIGQSGSEYVPPKGMGGAGWMSPGIPPKAPLAQHCPCDVLKGKVPLKAAVVAIDQRSVRLRLLEVLAGESELAVGAEFGGPYASSVGLCQGTGLSAEKFPVGSLVLAYFRPGDQAGHGCCEFLRCSRECSALWRAGEDNGGAAYDACDHQCEVDTVSVCENHREEAQLYGQLQFTPWSDDALEFLRDGDWSWTQPASTLPLIYRGGDSCEAQISDGYRSLIEHQEAQLPMVPDGGKALPNAGSGSVPPSPAQPPPPPGTAATMTTVAGQGAALPPAGPSAMGSAPTMGVNASSPSGPPSNPDDPYNRCKLGSQ